jgi:hypothetical protein
MSLRWGEEEDVLAAGMSSDATGYDPEAVRKGAEKGFKEKGKKAVSDSKGTASAAKAGHQQRTIQHGVNLVEAVGQSALTLGGLPKAKPKFKTETLEYGETIHDPMEGIAAWQAKRGK